MAVIEAKKGSDVQMYQEVIALHKRASRGKSSDINFDSVWAAQQEKKNNAETSRLENELKGYKNNLIKESIRVCAHHHALKIYIVLTSTSDGQRRSRYSLLLNRRPHQVTWSLLSNAGLLHDTNPHCRHKFPNHCRHFGEERLDGRSIPGQQGKSASNEA
jgi:hypothetical protein